MLDAELLQERLEERIAELDRARAWSPRLVARLELLLRTSLGSRTDWVRVSPRELAQAAGTSELEVVALFVHAAALDLLELECWRSGPPRRELMLGFSLRRA
jgi:hypothetical protein